MASVTLTTTSYVVLGLVQECEPATAYELKAFADRSIGYFWDFPRSQIYAESTKLVTAGLLDEEQEASGRRRRALSLTGAGRTALSEWVGTPSDAVSEIRDRGLLQLFFSQAVDADALAELARHQSAAHRTRLAEYVAIAAGFGEDAANDPTRVSLEAGLRFERLFVEFWDGIATTPPTRTPNWRRQRAQ